ncbi:hypothetical protein [Aquimarina algiphila]|nr:hypothetical protein [Aquimarina algiphila]
MGIDLIGCSRDFESSFSVERYKVLYRIEIQVVPFELCDLVFW